MTDTNPPVPAKSQEGPPPAHTARLGWLSGGLLGVLLGFLVTYLVETRVLTGRVPEPARTAAGLSSVFVAGLFLAGALGGHGLGMKGGRLRTRLLGGSAGVLVAVTLWALLVVTR
ncbi:MAG: hypothetical protein HY909_20155 [Deltaproteobacteria bacterium]|nr:hypothetical protein [Deltaproteobacteria bacterium]